MHTTVHTSLIRQSKALALLCELMEEEYQTLLGHNTDAVVALEFSIQELIRQLAAEKATIMKALAGVRAKEYAASLPQAEGAALLDLLTVIDRAEQEAARQATRNSQLSLALLDQSSRTLVALTSQVMPPKAETYGRRSGMRPHGHPEAALISGRL